MTQGNDHAQIVGQIQTGAKDLSPGPPRPQRLYLVAPPAMQEQKCHNEEAKKCNHLIGWQPRASDHFDNAIGQHPTGESTQSKANCLEFGIGSLHCLKQCAMPTLTERLTVPAVHAGSMRSRENHSLFVILIEFAVFHLACSIGFSFTLVVADREELRTDRVLGHEAVVVKGLEQRHVGNPFLRK